MRHNVHQFVPVFDYCLTISRHFKVVSEWTIHCEFDKIKKYLENTRNPVLIVHARDCVHPYIEKEHAYSLQYLKTYFQNNSDARLFYFSVNHYTEFDDIPNIDYFWFREYHAYYWPYYQNIVIEPGPITKKFLCLNKRICPARWLLYKKFYTDNLLDHSFFSFLGETELKSGLQNFDAVDRLELHGNFDEFARYQRPPQTFRLLDDDHDLANYLARSSKNMGLVDPTWILNHQFYSKSFCSVIVETAYNASRPNFSEKTFRAICNGHPVILVGVQHSIQFLRDLGFDVYDDIIDHSYDNEADSIKRIAKVFEVIDTVEQYSIGQLDQMKNNLLDRRLKNIQVYQNLYNTMMEKSSIFQTQLETYVQSKI
jgi:hypothetical protein